MTTATVAAPTSPYKGLAPFDDSDLDGLLFFGRARETEIVAANLLASRLTVLYGPSGVGKSSLLRAGVVRSLRGAAEPAPAVLVYGSWAGDPLEGLEEAASAAVAEAIGRPPTTAPGGLADRLAAWTAELGAELCLLLDQLEELFLYHGAAAGGFGELLPELVSRPGLRVNVLLGIRDDALARLDVFKQRLPGLFANSLRLDHLDHEAARAAILGPLDRYNRFAAAKRVEIEPDLVDAVLGEVEAGRIESGFTGRGGVEPLGARLGGHVETPYLQLVMQRIWDVETERGSDVLRLSTFRDLGGAQRIVEDHLERALRALTPAERDAAASVFAHLVTPSGTKIAHGVSDLATYASLGEADIKPVLRALARERILRPLGENGHSSGGRFEIFHDVLADPVLTWRAAHETHRQLEQERREAARRHRRLIVVAVVALAALAAMTAVALFALAQREEARSQRVEAQRQAQEARARELAANSAAQLQRDPARSVSLALDAVRLDRTRGLEDVLRKALLASRVRAVFPSRGPVRAAVLSQDGRLVVTASQDGTARLYDARRGAQLNLLRLGIPLETVAISRDGRLVAAGGRGPDAAVWRTSDGKRLAVLPHGGAVTDARFTRDGARLVTASADGSARVWDARSGRPLLRLEHPARVVSATFNRDGTRIMTVAADPYVRVFDSSTGAPLHSLAHPARVLSADFSASGRLIVTGSADGNGWIWFTDRGEMWKPLRGHEGRVIDVAFSPRGELVATASADGTARLWSAAEGTTEATLFGHGQHVVDVAFSPDGHALVTASKDRRALVWDARTGKPRATLIGSGDSVVSATFTPNSRMVLTASEDGTARLWDPQTEPLLRVVARHGKPVQSASFDADGRVVLTAGADGTARATSTAAERLGVVRHVGPVRAFAVAEGHRRAASADDTGVIVWKTPSGRQTRSFRHPAAVRSMEFSPDGTVLATGAVDGVVRLWDAETGRRLRVFRGHSGIVSTLSFSPDGRGIASAGDDRKALVWDVEGDELQTLEGHRGRLTSVSFSPDGSRILTTSEDASARLWRVRDGSSIAELHGHKDVVTFGTFSPDGSLVVTSSLDHDARLWNGRTGAPVEELRGHFAGVRRARFSPDGRWVVTAGPGTAALWQTATGDLTFFMRGHAEPLNDAAFSPDGSRIVTASDDGTSRIYSCRVCGDVDELIALAERRLARLRRSAAR